MCSLDSLRSVKRNSRHSTLSRAASFSARYSATPRSRRPNVLRVSLIGLSVDAGIVAVLLMIAGITLTTRESRWTRRPALLIVAVVVASTLIVFAVQTYSLRVFERRRDALRRRPVASIDFMTDISEPMTLRDHPERRC